MKYPYIVNKNGIWYPAGAEVPQEINIQEEKQEKLQEKEIKAKEHLEEMFEITRNLSYNDISLLKKYKNEKQEIEEKENNQNQKEIQE